VLYSVDLLKLMGTRIASDIVAENHVCNEQKLWRHVILNAFEDTKALVQIVKLVLINVMHIIGLQIQKILNKFVGGQDGNQTMLAYRYS
jgi:hypothetical protein